jgi:hypothetical protein
MASRVELAGEVVKTCAGGSSVSLVIAVADGFAWLAAVIVTLC